MEATNSSDEKDKPPSSGLEEPDQYETAHNKLTSKRVLALKNQPQHFSPLRESLFQSTSQTESATKAKTLPRKTIVIGEQTAKFRGRHYENVPDEQWNDWRWQLRNRIKDLPTLERLFALADDERHAIKQHNGSLPVSITPYYASLIHPTNPHQPLRRTVISTKDEYKFSPEEAADPLGEDGHSPVPGLVHRYPDRVLFLVTETCSVYCRYCTRSRMVGHKDTNVRFNPPQWEYALQYIARNKNVRDVLLSGGDPLTLADNRLDWLLSRLRQIPHVEIVRIGTKVPVVLPQRITPALTNVLKKYHPLFMSIHFTHPDELTPETSEACCRLADAGIPLGSQTVLLKGINDNVETMKKLMQGLLKIRVRPYYIYQCDPVLGSSHFRTSVKRGLDIIQGLRGHTSGYAVPSYVIDAPGGGGKIPLLPEYFQGWDGQDIVLKNYEGKVFRYPDRFGAKKTHSDSDDGGQRPCVSE
ncbi:KamA family radical SAM protein [candidate division KSB1 bacterium]|nr:KamA family radical SAM protein [candidate division KSB1 bacterium]RQW01966.1 MAG: KamA family radical SAM protein [candidate division KSB1 bacterium]